MKRKETLGRLLLSLATAFIMVVGAFAAAVYPALTDNAETPDVVSVREQDVETREIGDAPIGAKDTTTATGTWNANGAESGTKTNAIYSTQIPNISEAEREDRLAAGPDHTIKTETSKPADDAQPAGHGTRGPVVDADGPYGTQSNPLYEGNPINFQATVVGDDDNNYKFRWDVNDDGVFDGPGAAPDYWGAYGENSLFTQFNDNHMGVAKAEAWDGVSETPVSYSNRIWDEPSGTPPWYVYTGYGYFTFGMSFQVYSTTTIDQIGYYRYVSTRPYYFYNCRIWTNSGGLIYNINLGSGDQPSYPQWFYKDISPVTLTPGVYRVSTYTRTYAYYGGDNPGVTPDGVINPMAWYYGSGNVFPNSYLADFALPWLDIQYTYTVMEPDVGSDTADVWVDNVAPIPINPMALSAGPFYEGASVDFTGWLMDPGIDDDWWYMWDWGDGSYTDWFKVNKWFGGARILIACSYYEDELDAMENDLYSLLGPFATNIDQWNWGPAGVNEVFDLTTALQYDVIVVAENVIADPSLRDDMGDVLADYMDQGGNVVSCWVSDSVYGSYGEIGVVGRFRHEHYNVFLPDSLKFATVNLGTVYQPGHALLNTPYAITSVSAYYTYYAPGVESGAVRIADDSYGYPFVGYSTQPSGARNVGLAYMPIDGASNAGQFKELFANAVKWASRQPDPQPQPMPIQLDPIGHVFADDHPTHVTKSDAIEVTLIIKDDDHEKTVMTGSPMTFISEDFEGGASWPPGWYEGGDMNWQLHSPYQLYGSYCAFRTYYPYGWSYLYTPVMDFTTQGAMMLDWDNYWEANWPSGTQDGYVQVSVNGGAWVTLEEFHHLDPSSEVAHYGVTYGATAGQPSVQVRFAIDMYDDWYWEVDNVVIMSGSSYTMTGIGEASTTVDISNEPPYAVVPPELVGKVCDELITIDFEGVEIHDAAMDELTEEYWYRLDFDDGYGTGWMYKGTLGKPSFKILLATTWSGIQGTVQSMLLSELAEYEPTVDIYNWYTAGTPPDLSLMQQYDVVLVGTNYIPSTTLADQMGDRLYEYCQQGGNVVQMWSSFHTSARITGDWTANNYNPIVRGSLAYATESLGTVYDWDHPIMDGISDMSAYYMHNSYDANTNAIRLADYSSGKVLCAYADYNAHPAGNGRIAGLAFFPSSGYYGGDAIQMMVNCVKWAAGVTELNQPVIPTFSHDFGDNGIYNVDLMIIDDDMDWTWNWGSGSMLPTPGPDAEISHNTIPIEVYNTDPVIGGIGAWAQLDLCIRTTGEPNNDCTMTLMDGTGVVGSVTVYHDGNYKMETLPATLDVLRINDYSVIVEYENSDPDGANPTWIFEGRFPTGHIKELKKVFKEDGDTWLIGPELLKTMLLGEEIIFTSAAYDQGSDDLAFVWNFGDSTPFGVHIYANAGGSVAGTSDEATVIFNQLPNREPWFDRPANDIRSPLMNPMLVQDMITHVFDEEQPYYYYVSLTVLDDDNSDGYPSTELHLLDGTDTEVTQVDLS